MENNPSKKYWELPEWKVTRDRLLKDYCEQCQKENSIFVLIHLKPTPKGRSIGIKVRNEMISELITQNKIIPFELTSDQKLNFSRNSCPECHSLSLRIRKIKKPKFKCNNCSAETENPHVIINYEDYELRNLKNKYYSEKLIDYRFELENRYKVEMNKVREWYLSGDDTATFCKSCAFQHRKGRILCKNCKEHYHTKNYEMCFYCVSIPCIACGNNRILRTLETKVCEECIIGNPESNKVKLKICIICNKNKIELGSKIDKAICDRCVLDGHWIE